MLSTSAPEGADWPGHLLVLGGTSWLGGAVARVAVARGHRVTCLARGLSGDPPPGARLVPMDRAVPGAYDEVAGTDVDAVVEVSWQVDFVRSALDALADRVQHWVYVSSVSVYADDATPGADESAAIHPPTSSPDSTGTSAYAAAKVACENAVLTRLGQGRCTIARAGLIGGHGDRSDRFGYWPARLSRARPHERVLAPMAHTPVQVIDVLDLAEWLVDCAERRIAGTFNATGDPITFGEVFDACARAAGTTPTAVEASDEWLLAHGVEPYMGEESLPLWLPQREYAGHSARANAAAKAAGLRLRPIAETARTALDWERELGPDRQRRAGLSADRERSLLHALTGRRPPSAPARR